jgi:hypothetical protein
MMSRWTSSCVTRVCILIGSSAETGSMAHPYQFSPRQAASHDAFTDVRKIMLFLLLLLAMS